MSRDVRPCGSADWAEVFSSDHGESDFERAGMNRDELSLRGRLGAYATNSRHDTKKLTAPARAAFLDRFERIVDPKGELPVAERFRRAELAKKAYFTRLAMRSARARRTRGEAR